MSELNERAKQIEQEAQQVFDFGVSSYGVSYEEAVLSAKESEEKSAVMRQEGSPQAALKEDKAAIRARRAAALFAMNAPRGTSPIGEVYAAWAAEDLQAEEQAADRMFSSMPDVAAGLDLYWSDGPLYYSGRRSINGRFWSALVDPAGERWNALVIANPIGPGAPLQAPTQFYSVEDAKAWCEATIATLMEDNGQEVL